jgi:solute carrier family 8 (sodium/calcium exchanger)
MISDLANLFGCVIGLSGEITAITFVALGTSVPDTFASRIAIQQDDNADSAITNVTGSNSVNVFLGLGLSWGISAIYWATQDVPSARWTRTLNVYEFKSGDDIRGQYADKFGAGKPFFFVDAGNLGFSVGVFSGCSLLAFAILHYQKTQGGELGGPNRNKMAAAFVSIWLIFLIMYGGSFFWIECCHSRMPLSFTPLLRLKRACV